MEYNIDKAIEILSRTSGVLNNLLTNLSAEWTSVNEGGESWSAFDVVGHLIEGEKHDWIGRTNIILSEAEDRSFKPFDRFSQVEATKGKSLNQLLKEFEELREKNITKLLSLGITNEDLNKTGTHPEFGTVTLKEHLSTWVTHDLGHLAQISRVMAKQYKTEVGPWLAYIPILKDK